MIWYIAGDTTMSYRTRWQQR